METRMATGDVSKKGSKAAADKPNPQHAPDQQQPRPGGGKQKQRDTKKK
jgi:hypothetical protein